ncbi:MULTISPECIES: hypothetical protein [Leucobacter]|uniref:hypothetical protein n=1 Tax=Leucobacter TaxID=55968 RepID=UPI0012E01464|nr:hypothetical protein [Leucobacter sp. Ag1]
MERQAELLTQIEAIVRAVPEVEDLYRSGSVLTNALQLGAEAIGVRDGAAPLAELSERDGERYVEIAIGVRAGAGVPQTLEHVHEALRGVTAERGIALRLTVVHIADRVD